MRSFPLSRLVLYSILALSAFALGGCASALQFSSDPSETGFRFFVKPEPQQDFWYTKVDDWQLRERAHRPQTALADPATVRAKPNSGLLSVKMGRWETDERLGLARRLAKWAQAASRRHYRFDGPNERINDPWPTTKDLLDRNGDDCDGLDLIVYEMMREFGFPEEQLYRAIVRRNRDRANHMVTLWFDETDDPWVIDATGAVTLHVRRFSTLPGWTPTKVFNEHVQYSPMVKKGFASR
ncbi:MAG: hypothetical protein ACR2P8_15790 [Myxococcota bacterium]